MTEPFKNFINHELIERIGQAIQNVWDAFDAAQFVKVACADLDAKELKERCFAVVEGLEQTLPNSFPEAADIMMRSLHPDVPEDETFSGMTDGDGIRGWPIMAFQEYVGKHGLEHPMESLNLLREMTKRLTSEFGIRYFIEAHPTLTLRQLQAWVKDPSVHVRRLVSEGTRPRLPWGMQLKQFIKDPSPTIPLLDCLKDDTSEYVRRSVANHLNDIAKDHPDIVCKVAETWWIDASKDRKRLIKHALRTLIKKGNPRALAILGYGEAKISVTPIQLSKEIVLVGDTLEFSIELSSESSEEQELLVDYAVHFKKANGSLSPKVFKWTQFTLGPREVRTLAKKQSFKVVSTRVLYPGEHQIEILINGASQRTVSFELSV